MICVYSWLKTNFFQLLNCCRDHYVTKQPIFNIPIHWQTERQDLFELY